MLASFSGSFRYEEGLHISPMVDKSVRSACTWVGQLRVMLAFMSCIVASSVQFQGLIRASFFRDTKRSDKGQSCIRSALFDRIVLYYPILAETVHMTLSGHNCELSLIASLHFANSDVRRFSLEYCAYMLS